MTRLKPWIQDLWSSKKTNCATTEVLITQDNRSVDNTMQDNTLRMQERHDARKTKKIPVAPHRVSGSFN